MALTNNTKKKKKFFIPVIIVVVLAVIAGGVFAFEKNLFLKPGDKVLLAATESFQGDDLTDTISSLSDFTSQDSLSMECNFTLQQGAEDTVISASLDGAVDRKEGSQSLSGTLNLGGKNLSVKEYMDQKQFAFTLPDVSDKVLTYYFNEKVTGALASNAEESSFKKFKKSLKSTAGLMKESGDKKEISSILREYFNQLDWSVDRSASTTIAGKDTTCKAYSTEISGEWLKNFCSDLREVYDLDDVLGFCDKFMDVDSLDDLEDKFDSLDNLPIVFYLKDNTLVKVEITSDDTNYSLGLAGEDCPWHDLYFQQEKLISSDITGLEILTAVDSDCETLSVRSYDSEENLDASDLIQIFTYDLNSGDFTFYGDNEKKLFTGSLTCSDQEASFSIDMGEINLQLQLTSSGEVESLSGDIINLNKITSEELTEFAISATLGLGIFG